MTCSSGLGMDAGVTDCDRLWSLEKYLKFEWGSQKSEIREVTCASSSNATLCDHRDHRQVSSPSHHFSGHCSRDIFPNSPHFIRKISLYFRKQLGLYRRYPGTHTTAHRLLSHAFRTAAHCRSYNIPLHRPASLTNGAFQTALPIVTNIP